MQENKHWYRLPLIFAGYCAIWAWAVIAFWFPQIEEDAMGFSLLFLWTVLPLASLILSFVAGRLVETGWERWFLPVAFGFMFMMAEHLTFGLANHLQFQNTNPPEWLMMIPGTLLPAVGMTAGIFVRRKLGKNQEKRTEEKEEAERIEEKEKQEEGLKKS